MKSKIINSASSKHYLWGQGCDSWVLVDSPGLSVKQERMPAGTKEVLHFHSVAQQFFYVLKGVASFYVNGQKQLLEQQQGVLIPPTVKHCIANETTSDLLFLVTSQPSAHGDRTVVKEQTIKLTIWK